MTDHTKVVDEIVPVEKKKIGKKIAKGFGIFILVIAGLYLAVSAFFSQFFFYDTEINGEDVSFMNISKVRELQAEGLKDYQITLEGSDGVTDVILGADIDVTYQNDDQIEKILKKQNPFLWPEMFMESREGETIVHATYDEAKLEEKINGLEVMVEANWTEPQDAYPDVVGDKFEIIPEQYGTKINRDNLKAKIGEFVSSTKDTLVLLDNDVYQIANYTQESQELIDLTAELNKYAAATITYPEGYKVDAEVMSSWLTYNDQFEVTLSEDKVREYVATQASTIDTVGTTRTFTAPNGREVTASGGTYGWRMDQEAEVAMLLENLRGGVPVEREYQYSRRAHAYAKDGIDWGNTYIEIDIGAQKVYIVKDGQVVHETNTVTGDISDGNGTPEGIFQLTYKTTNAVLRGDRLPDGSYSYESPVKFWMPFNGGIGLHDASWRSTFGGSIYRTNGSHGCINLPYNSAKEIYNFIEADTPIICHF